MAADESTSTILKRFNTIKLESTEENRRAYREMLFTTPGAGEFISGVILFDETIRQKTKDGVPFPAYLSKHGMIPGIKVDTGAKPLAGFPGETITEGLDGLRERLAEYYKLGARFAKWRAVIDIGAGIPSRYAISANAEALARYAALCQEAGIVPIVEPEVLMDGDHPIARCEEVTEGVLQTVFDHLFAARIFLEGMVLKPNMVIAGKKSAQKSSPEQVAEATDAHAEAARALGGPGHRVSIGRSESHRGDPALEPDECHGAAPLGAHLQLWTRVAGHGAARLGRHRSRVPGRPEAAVHAREAEWPSRGRHLQAGHGNRGLTS